ncbi:hypothetical protein GN244_ATG12904 [Phytophthora infestans]|uniref:M96 mating-specific protein family n=1 Tax=Phytophthora infestans TaxID=4787 RepID=A0A833S762_PHYIN|nr:hypothetical protein GN244_ATG12904 [Phytophthora infestans]
MGILVPQPFPLSQTPLPDSDEVLQDFLHEMAELDRLEVPKTPEPKLPKRKAIDTPPRPAKKAKKAVDQSYTKRQPQTQATQDKTPMTRWQRRKQELETLKQQAETLGDYVAFLQARRVPGLMLQGFINLPPQLEQLVELQSGGWQAAAIWEIRRCQSSQQENKELKERLQGCVQDSGKLQTALNTAQARVHLSHDTRCGGIQDRAGVAVRCGHGLECLLASGRARLETTRARVVRRSQDVVSSDWCFPVELEEGETVEIRVRSVAKRFAVQQGFVVLAESTTEWPPHLAASGVWSRVTRESGWGLVHSYPPRSVARGSSSSVSRFLVYMSSVPTGLDCESSRKLLGSPAVSDVVIPSFQKLIRNRQQCVDNHLMDAAFLHGSSSISAI